MGKQSLDDDVSELSLYWLDCRIVSVSVFLIFLNLSHPLEVVN